MSVCSFIIILLLVVVVVVVSGQEVQVSLQEDIVLDVSPCEPGSLDCLPIMPSNTRLLDTVEEIITNITTTTTTTTSFQTLNLFSEELYATEEDLLEVSVLIHMGLDSPLSSSILIEEENLQHISEFHEYFSLQVLSDGEPWEQCPQGFNTSWQDSALIEFVVCPYRWGYEEILTSSKAPPEPINFLPPLVPFHHYIFQQATLTAQGYYFIMINQESLIAVPCLPGNFCPDTFALSSPHQCPLGTYNAMYGQSQCIICPLNYFTLRLGSSSFQDCLRYDDQTSSVESFMIFSAIFGTPTGAVVPLEYQNMFKNELVQWLSTTLQNNFTVNSDTQLVIHILNWN
jgi:hypothetical protein